MDRKEIDIEKSAGRGVFRRLLAYARPYMHWMFFSLVLVLFITMLELYRPIIVGKVIDLFMDQASFAAVRNQGLLYLAVLLASFACNFLQTWVLQLTGQSIIYNIREEVFDHVTRLSLRFFDITPVGRIVTRVTNDVEALHEMYANILVRLIKNVVKIVGLAAMMLVLNVRIALFSFALLPFIVALTVLFKRISRMTYRITRTKLTALNTYLSEHLSGMRVIQIFAREREKNAEFGRKNKDLYRANYREMMVFAVFRPSIYFLSIIALVSIIYTGSASVLEGVITVGTLYTFIEYINSFFQPIQELAEQFGTLQSAMASAEKIFTLLDEDTMIPEPKQPVSPEKLRGRIAFEHVWFAYQGEEWILKDVSFTIEPGSRVAFVGATGAGKSSILNLIGRYYDIQRGRITVDGIDIRELDKSRLRAAIGQVQQDVFIFTGDIGGNIRLKNASITDDQVEQAAKYVNAYEFISRLPGGYREPVTE
ncbi:MAG: ABC transporter ATP-binding protein/permease, partial [Lachnospiraceae bacterium]|nr:ABC transporter ATP-binding protein/permease [Lachnospiraceae bacterium]